MSTRETLLAPVEQAVESHGAHLIDLNVRGDRGRPVIEVYVDNEAGVTSDLCAEISRSVMQSIETGGMILGPFRLDVSSPGIDRPLRFSWQYTKHMGRPVAVVTRSGGTIDGTLDASDATAVTVTTKAGSQQVLHGDIVELRVKAPW
jgi:ribosome maturation factor RimP